MYCPAELFKPPFLYNILFFVGIFSLSAILTTWILRSKKRSNLFVFLAGSLLLLLTLIPVAGAFLALLSAGPLANYYPDRKISQMNAAIKNTCLVDPLKRNCPQNLDQVINLYPQDFQKLQTDYVFTYAYYPEQNNYTLIARPKSQYMNLPFGFYIAVFDQRMVGSDYSRGFDFINTRGYVCDGKYHLESPPPIAGPWEDIN